MDYHLWCDESVKKGDYFSDFYGGILLKSIYLKEVNERLTNKKLALGINSELKWSKITSHYLNDYKLFIDEVFDLLEEDKIKVRIMFRQSAIQAANISNRKKEHSFHLLYYQFIKHAFGLKFSNSSGDNIFLKTYFDKLPDTKEKNELFKNHIYALQSLKSFADANIKLRRDDIAEVNSKVHIELQAIDIILGAMSFRLNDKHKVIPKGKRRRGKRTIAKEKVYKHISSRIRELYPNFNIGISTGKKGDITNFWNHPYRHWKFIPKEFYIDEEKFK